MAIKINLLPQSYDLEKKRNRWIAGMAGLLGVTALSIGLLYASDQKQLQKEQADFATMKAVADQTVAAQTATTTATNATASIKGVVDFMTDASRTGAERAALIDLMRRYIYQNAVVSDLDLSSGNSVKMTARIRTPDEYARFLTALRQGTKNSNGGNTIANAGKVFDTEPIASGIPGFPAGVTLPTAPALSEVPEAIVFPREVNAAGALKTDPNPRNALMYVPTEPVGTLVSAGGGGAGGGGAPGGSPAPGAVAASGAGSASPSASGAPR